MPKSFRMEKRDKHHFAGLRYLMVLFFVATAVVTSFVFATPCEAGFGVSPPYIKNKQLVPGSTFKQTITLLRSDANEDLKATIKLNAPEIESWFEFEPEFILPAGEVQIPTEITVNIPSDAEVGNYQGNMSIRITPINDEGGGGVSIALGARVDIDLTLTNISYSDFMVRVVSIPNFELPGKPWSWPIFSKFLNEIRVVMTLENIGNVETAPSKVTLDVYDILKKGQLESLVDEKIDKVASFSVGDSVAAFRTSIGPGQYWGKVRVYRENEVVNSYEIAFTIFEPGSGNTIMPMGWKPWVLLISYSIILIILLFVLIRIRFWRYLFIILFFIFRVIRAILRPIGRMLKYFNSAFWRWMSSKAEKYGGK